MKYGRKDRGHYKGKSPKKDLTNAKVHTTHTLLEVVDQELKGEADVVSRVNAMPDSQEHEGGERRQVAVVEELHALVDVP